MGASRSLRWLAAVWLTVAAASAAAAAAAPCESSAPTPSSTPTPTPTPTPTSTGAGVGDDCCDSTCGIMPPVPCRDGLTCVAPAPSEEPGVVIDGWMGKCAAEGAGVGGTCCDSTCGIMPPMPCRDGLTCVAPAPSKEPGLVVDGWTGKCAAGATPTPTPTGAGVGGTCCDSSCGIMPPMPCRDGLTCVAPAPSVEPGVIVDGWTGTCARGGSA